MEAFFRDRFRIEFEVYIHPDRASLDSTWQHDWKMPEFKSECWMVASGIASKLDIIRPSLWDKQSCEHSYSDKAKLQQLITHELVHVFHGQRNISPDFSAVTGIDWFVEGLATFVAGQGNDAARKAELRSAIINGKAPASLDNFWKGKLRYSQSGAIVQYLDEAFGREKIINLLRYDTKDKILSHLQLSEGELIEQFKRKVTGQND